MIRAVFAAALLVVVQMQSAGAQQSSSKPSFWVQIEAQPSLAEVNEALRRRSASLQDVNGFDLGGSNWYVVALGPYARGEAQDVLQRLRFNGRIPRDSYIAESADYDRQIWPVGANALSAGSAPDESGSSLGQLAEALRADNEAEAAQQTQKPEPQPEKADETPREARAGEAQLTRTERETLQIALKWAGHYQGRIDAQFGRGTRRSMASWQRANGHEPTGVLTTRQRASLMTQYNAVLDGLGMARVSDAKMGIEMQLPTDVVELSKYEPPFAHFDSTGDIPARVVMISQKGDEDTLHGLYNIMQTLEIVPQDGPRRRDRDSFTLEGENARIVSHTEARLEDGRIKGFTLVWPSGDEERRGRVLRMMQDSFTRTAGVLDAATGYDDDQSIDLVSGLEVRKPIFSRSGFFVDDEGTVVTTSEVVDACGRITIENDQEVEIAASDADLGVAMLRPRDALAPLGVAGFAQGTARIESEVTLAGYSYGGVLSAPSLTHGTVSDIRGLDGNDAIARLALGPLEGDAGGPVLDDGGSVIGMLRASDKTKGRTLPDGVAFAVDARALTRMLEDAGMRPTAAGDAGKLAPAQLSDRAGAMTVLVRCWE